MENVKASVPGTTQAQEAVIANSDPADGDASSAPRRSKPITFDGAPQLQADRGHVAPVRRQRVDADHHDRRPTPTTPARAASGSPPPRSTARGRWPRGSAGVHLHDPSRPRRSTTSPTSRSTARRRASSTSATRRGTRARSSPTASSSTAPGYVYTPWIGTVWYGPPVTYGYGVNLAYTPWTGWGFAFGIGCGFAMGAAMCGYGWGYAGWGWGAACGGWYGGLRRGGLGPRRRRGLGTGLRALVLGQRLQPVGLDERRDPQRRRIQRLDGQRVARIGRRLLQLRRPASPPRASAEAATTPTPATTRPASAAPRRTRRPARAQRAPGARSATPTPATPSRADAARSPAREATPRRSRASTATTAVSPRSATTSTPTTTGTSTRATAAAAGRSTTTRAAPGTAWATARARAT